jgi:cytochrome bd-type quinol oxidase subunit 1
MKTLFLLLDLLTDSDAIRNIVHSCLTAAVVSVAVLLLLGAYQLLRRSCTRPRAVTSSRS